MAPITWLPPLRLHEDFDLSVTLLSEHPYDNSSKSLPFYFIKIHVSATFYSDHPRNQRIFKGLDMAETFVLPCSLLEKNAKAQLKAMLGYVSVPFELQEITFRHGRANGSVKTFGPKMDEDCLLGNICGILRDLRTEYQEFPRNVFPVTLLISKKICVPDAKIKAWCLWYGEMANADPGFENYYSSAIGRSRTRDELKNEGPLQVKLSLDEDHLRAVSESENEGDQDQVNLALHDPLEVIIALSARRNQRS